MNDRQRFDGNIDESNFRSPTPGPDYAALNHDSISLEDLIERLTPTSYTTPEVKTTYQTMKELDVSSPLVCSDNISLSNTFVFENFYQSDFIIQSSSSSDLRLHEPLHSGNEKKTSSFRFDRQFSFIFFFVRNNGQIFYSIISICYRIGQKHFPMIFEILH